MDKSRNYLENLDNIFNGDMALILKACQSFIKHSKTYMEALHNAHRQKNISEIKRIAHSFKASFAMFGDTDAQKAACELEQIRADGPWDEYDIKIKRFDEHLQSTVNSVQSILDSSFKDT